MAFFYIILVVIFILGISLKIVKEYERGVKFTLGKFSKIMEPGPRLVFPVIQAWRRVDLRTSVIDVPKQDAMTKDNVSVVIDAVLYFRVSHPDKAIIEVMDYYYAISQLAQTTMRDIVGQVILDQLLGKREEISKKILSVIDKDSGPWGIKVEAVELKDIILPQSLVRSIAQEAEAEREKRAVIIRADGELQAAANIAKAAHTLSHTKGGLHIRTLQTINSLGSEKSKTIVYAVPSEVIKYFVSKKV